MDIDSLSVSMHLGQCRLNGLVDNGVTYRHDEWSRWARDNVIYSYHEILYRCSFRQLR
jgi:hypothetical protein